MNELHNMVKRIVLYTVLLGCICSVIGVFFIHDLWHVLGGLWIGILMSLFGFYMIIQLTERLKNPNIQGKKEGISSYVTRYIFYGLVMALFAYLGFSLIAMLVGVICHKSSILVYACIEKRREDSNVPN